MGDLIDIFFTPWGWVGLGLILLALEVLVPGAFILWLGLAALMTAVSTGIFGLGLELQLTTFAIYSVISVLIGRSYFRRRPDTEPDVAVNAPATRQIGNRVTVVDAIEGGKGRVRMGDTTWSASGADAPVGTQLTVIGIEGATLKVSAE